MNCFLWWETDSTRNPFSRATLCQATLPSGNTIVLRPLMRSKSLDSTTCFLFSVAGRLREANVAKKNYRGQVRENTRQDMSTLFSHQTRSLAGKTHSRQCQSWFCQMHQCSVTTHLRPQDLNMSNVGLANGLALCLQSSFERIYAGTKLAVA